MNGRGRGRYVRPYVSEEDQQAQIAALGEQFARAMPSGDPRLAADPQLAAVKQLWADRPEVGAEMNALVAPRQPELNYGAPPPEDNDIEQQLKRALGAMLIGQVEGIQKRGEQREHQQFQLGMARETAAAERGFRASESAAERDQREAMQKERLDAEDRARQDAFKLRETEWQHEKSPQARIAGEIGLEAAKRGRFGEAEQMLSGQVAPQGTATGKELAEDAAAKAKAGYDAMTTDVLNRYESEGRSGKRQFAMWPFSIGARGDQPGWLADQAEAIAERIRQSHDPATASTLLRSTLSPLVNKLYEQMDPYLPDEARGATADAIVRVKRAQFGPGNEGVNRDQVLRAQTWR